MKKQILILNKNQFYTAVITTSFIISNIGMLLFFQSCGHDDKVPEKPNPPEHEKTTHTISINSVDDIDIFNIRSKATAYNGVDSVIVKMSKIGIISTANYTRLIELVNLAKEYKNIRIDWSSGALYAGGNGVVLSVKNWDDMLRPPLELGPTGTKFQLAPGETADQFDFYSYVFAAGGPGDIIIENAAEFADKCNAAVSDSRIEIKGDLSIDIENAIYLKNAIEKGASFFVGNDARFTFTVNGDKNLVRLGLDVIAAACAGQSVIDIQVAINTETGAPYTTVCNQSILDNAMTAATVGTSGSGIPSKASYSLRFVGSENSASKASAMRSAGIKNGSGKHRTSPNNYGQSISGLRSATAESQLIHPVISGFGDWQQSPDSLFAYISNLQARYGTYTWDILEKSSECFPVWQDRTPLIKSPNEKIDFYYPTPDKAGNYARKLASPVWYAFTYNLDYMKGDRTCVTAGDFVRKTVVTGPQKGQSQSAVFRAALGLATQDHYASNPPSFKVFIKNLDQLACFYDELTYRGSSIGLGGSVTKDKGKDALRILIDYYFGNLQFEDSNGESSIEFPIIPGGYDYGWEMGVGYIKDIQIMNLTDNPR